MRSSRRRASPASPPRAADSGDERDAEAQTSLCVVCSTASARVAIGCSSCAKLFHLACLTPPLRRRPVLADAWKCTDCAGADGSVDTSVAIDVAETRSSRKRSSNVKAVVKEEVVEEDSDAPLVKKRRTKAATVKSEPVPTKSDSDDEFEETQTLPKLRTPPARGKRKAALSARGASKNGKQRRAAPKRQVAVEDSGDDAESLDDDNDSDFEADRTTSSDDESASLSDASESEPQARRRSTPNKRNRAAAPARGGKQRSRTTSSPARSAEATTAPNGSDVDSLDIPGTARLGESDSEEDVYDGPVYHIEYARDSRAKCKSCEKKLMAGEIRVGVHVRHSMFGDTTYYKHLECSQLCLSGELSGSSSDEATVKTDTSSNEAPVDPIKGFKTLKAADQVRVSQYMEKNAADGVVDERSDITEEHYQKKLRLPEKDPSKFLTVPLLPYQREALGWMIKQEASDYKGGILADEMGMGKTIQAISLILEKPRIGAAGKAKKGGMIRGGTLVVCPVVAVMQWKAEIERFVETNHLSVYIHHGAKRDTLASKIASFDVVLTTYSIVEFETRKMLGWQKVPCKYCNRKFLPEKLVQHNKYFCGPNAKKTQLQDKQQRKRPKKRAAGEVSEEEDDYPKKPAKGKGRGSAKKKPPTNDVSSEDEIPVPKKLKEVSPLHQIQWTRIILDEAHYIKDRNCNTARGVFELKSDYKWCLTGTPLQNRIGELFSLIRFLQIKSYAYYHCSSCDCQMLDYNFPNKKCKQCPHPAIQHFSYFNKKIVIPIQAYGYVAEGKIAMLRLQNNVLQHILLRRTKEGRADDISLPPKLIRIRRDRLDERENDFYEAIYTQSQAQFNTYVSSGTLLNNYAHIFDLLVRLRQAVDHPYLVIYSKSNPALQLPIQGDSQMRPIVEEKPFGVAADDSNSDEERPCTICHEDVEDVVVAKCGHDFCRECAREYIESIPLGGAATCPACSKPLTVELSPKIVESELPAVSSTRNLAADTKNASRKKPLVDLSRFHKSSILHRVSDIASFQTSTKIEALMQELELMRVRDPSGKAIIFSQFVNMLDIIQHRLHLGGVKCVKLSGNMTMDVRDRTIRAFREDSTITAFLVSLKAGGVALNLTIASHIYLMDPWWNPAAENQAIDRTHRLGQFKPVQATRFIIAGTVEERILKLQEKKRLIFEGTVGASVSAICRLTEEDLRFLFSR